jgi:hypothetical protein
MSSVRGVVSAAPDALLAYAMRCQAMDEELGRLPLEAVDAGLAGDVRAFARRGVAHDRWVEGVARRFIVAMAGEVRPVLERGTVAERNALLASLFPLVTALRTRWPKAVMGPVCSGSGSAGGRPPREVAEALDVLEGRGVVARKRAGVAEAFVAGAIEGSFDDVGYAGMGSELARVLGATVSGLFLVGDLRDAAAEGSRGNAAGVAWNLFGAIPVAGDLGKGIEAGAEGLDAVHDARNAARSLASAARLIRDSEGPGRGHLVARHVGKSVAFLESDVASSGRKVASTFSTPRDAAVFVDQVRSQHADEIATWLQRSTQRDLELDGRFAEVTGIALRRGSLSAEETHGVRIVLRKDRSARGYYLVTGFPKP